MNVTLNRQQIGKGVTSTARRLGIDHRNLRSPKSDANESQRRPVACSSSPARSAKKSSSTTRSAFPSVRLRGNRVQIGIEGPVRRSHPPPRTDRAEERRPRPHAGSLPIGIGPRSKVQGPKSKVQGPKSFGPSVAPVCCRPWTLDLGVRTRTRSDRTRCSAHWPLLKSLLSEDVNQFVESVEAMPSPTTKLNIRREIRPQGRLRGVPLFHSPNSRNGGTPPRSTCGCWERSILTRPSSCRSGGLRDQRPRRSLWRAVAVRAPAPDYRGRRAGSRGHILVEPKELHGFTAGCPLAQSGGWLPGSRSRTTGRLSGRSAHPVGPGFARLSRALDRQRTGLVPGVRHSGRPVERTAVS